jgi:hypothetical protein
VRRAGSGVNGEKKDAGNRAEKYFIPDGGWHRPKSCSQCNVGAEFLVPKGIDEWYGETENCYGKTRS